jgi:hypothetical protein
MGSQFTQIGFAAPDKPFLLRSVEIPRVLLASRKTRGHGTAKAIVGVVSGTERMDDNREQSKVRQIDARAQADRLGRID